MNSVDRLARMPHWPIRMSEDIAALYLGISKSSFRTRWEKRRDYPQPVREGARLLWHREQLRRFVDAQFGLAQAPAGATGGDTSWDDLD